jgi:putative ABC transport system permease protein
MRNIGQDLKYGVRVLLKSPGFSAAAVIVLALGIGANTAIFSVVNAVLLRPLPFRDPSRIAMIYHVPPQKSFPGMKIFSVSPANFLDWRAQSQAFDSMAIFHGTTMTVTGKDQPEALSGLVVSSEFFSALGATPLLGRTFTPEEDRSGHSDVVVLTHPLWQTRFGGDPQVVGKTLSFNGRAYSIIGVLPAGFHFFYPGQYFVPLGWTDEDRAVRDNHNYLVISRLKPEVSIAQAQAEIDTISARLEQSYPQDDKGWGATIVPLREDLVGDVRPALLVLLGAAAFVLLIACANVANLVLARTLPSQGNCDPNCARSNLGASTSANARGNSLAVAGGWFAGFARGAWRYRSDRRILRR